jgi:hypothetical protein
MKERILALGLPASVVSLGVGVGWWGSKSGLISQQTWFYLWPLLVAIGFLALSIGALIIGARRWLLPMAVGFLVQLIGWFFLLGNVGFESAWEPFIYTLLAVGLVLFGMFAFWLVATLRARSLEKNIVDGVAGGEGIDAQKIAEIRNNMLQALTMLKRAGLGRNAIYELPWFLVIGRSQAGKTVAIKNSGLGLPVKKDRVKGVGGTHTCDFFFTNDLIFLDTPGAWVTEGAGEEGQAHWVELLRLLRKYRGRRPLDGLVIVVPADDLLTKSDEDLEEQAANIRQVVDCLHDELRFRFPVYLVVSKSDLVEGFIDFFRGLPAQRRGEIVGWSHTDPNRGDPERLIPKGFQRLVQRLQAYRLEMMARIASVTRARKLFFFTEEMKSLERPLTVFASVLFEPDQYHEQPVFRGFYFTSGTQGEGTPMGRAMAKLAETLGIHATHIQAAPEEEEPKRSYFLLELFRTLLLGDQGLVSRTAVSWWRMRRDTMLVAFSPAIIAVLVFLTAFLSFGLNSCKYRQIATRVPAIVEELRSQQTPVRGKRLLAALSGTNDLKAFHRALAGPTLWNRFWGMRRPGELAGQALAVFRREFEEVILRPTFEEIGRYSLDPRNSCTERIDVLYSVVYLRLGYKWEEAEDLKGLDAFWDLSGDTVAEAREQLLWQFAYLENNTRKGESLLPGISLAKAADSIVAECRDRGPGSPMDGYRKFQEECGDLPTNYHTTQCRILMDNLFRAPAENYDKLDRNLNGLREGLDKLEDVEPEAGAALRALNMISVTDQGISRTLSEEECLRKFDGEIMPAVKAFMNQDDLISECRTTWNASGKDNLKALELVNSQNQKLEDEKKALRSMVGEFTGRCEKALGEPFVLDFDVLDEFAYKRRYLSCIDGWEHERPPEPEPVVARPARGGTTPPRPKAEPLTFLAVDRRPDYSISSWNGKWEKEWDRGLQLAANSSPGEREQKKQDVLNLARSYAVSYRRAWERYLDGITAQARGGASVPGWLEGLADTGEFMRVLEPALSALETDKSTAPSEYKFLSEELRDLESLGDFVKSRLSIYRDGLRGIARDLRECEQDATQLNRYRSQLNSGDGQNKLVALQEWVRKNAGPGLVDGKLEKLFLQPLLEAETYAKSPDLTLMQWNGLLTQFSEVAAKYPFTTEGAEELASLKDMVALFGGRSGIVPVLSGAVDRGAVSPEADRWLTRAGGLAEILFAEDTDDLRPYTLKLSIEGFSFDPAELEKKFQVREVEIHLGEGVDWTWKDAEPDKKLKTLQIDLVGEVTSDLSYIAAWVSERKGFLGRAFTENFKDPERFKAGQAEGHWAPLRLLSAGAEDGFGAGGSTFDLKYLVELPYKKDEPGKLTLNLRVNATGLPELMQLMKSGLPKPPESLAGP